MIHLDTEACSFGWGPCPDAWGFNHNCKKREGHVGYHICDWCDNRKRTDRQVVIDALRTRRKAGETP